jgi:phospholipid/cholesterol/gamma-HCH transport system substrate-binding protein
MSPFRAGVLTLVVILVAAYFGFTKSNPFADPYELRAIVRDAQNLKPGSPVREAGVEVGKVSKVEAAEGREPATRITMELREDALPVHEDARLQIRPRILLEGNFFVDLEPGSSQAAALEDGGTVPITQTSSAVTLPEVLSVLESDTRTDLQTLLREYATAVDGGGARALNRAIASFEPAYRLSAITNDALLGEQPTEDLHRVLRNQARVFGTLSENPQTLQDLVTDLNTTAGAIASQDSALEAAVPALRDTLREG